MANPTLDAFIRDALNNGKSRERIHSALVAAGWSEREVADGLDDYAESDLGIAVPRPRRYVSAREAFLYLVFFILLAIVALNLGSLLFALIDIAIPDALEQVPGQGVTNHDFQVRSSIAGLVVGGPLFAWLAIHINALREKNPAMLRSRVRKWLTYVTLVVASCTLIGDTISLVFSFLAGELSTRLLFKLLVVAALAGGIFYYFIRDAEKDDVNEQTA